MARNDIASLKATFSGMKLRNELAEKTRLKNMNELTAKIHRRFVVLERKLAAQPEHPKPSHSTLSATQKVSGL